MTITLLQTDIARRAAAPNMARAAALMDAHPGADLYVLPEMWATSFDMEPCADTFRAADEGLQFMLREARRRQCCIAGTLPADTPEGRRNRFYVTGREGIIATYDKRHLFTYGGEQRAYTPGRDRTVVTIGGVRILLQTCYDLRFPAFSRCRGDFDLILYAANWPAARRTAWEVLLRARAIENQCYVCGINRIGQDTAAEYSGGTMAIDPRGNIPAAAPDGREAAVTLVPDMDALRAFRTKFPALADADVFAI